MWLLPAFSPISRLATHTYYRLAIEGYDVPRQGPVLLVANHPNSLLDPALVAAAAGRPVRFLAKAALFEMPVLGWLVRGAGSIPVHRRQDDPALMEKNVEAFAAVDDALAEGCAVGIFPEGKSHDEPSMAPLRTGAARIALTAAARTGDSFPIVPMGLVFRKKEVFRSEAMVYVGRPIDWDDLVPAGPAAPAVRELTERIDRALRRVTINLTAWEDAPLVEAADEIYAAELGNDHSAAARVARVRAGLERLAELRGSSDERWRSVAHDVLRHQKLLHRIGITPRDVARSGDLRRVARGAARDFPRLSFLAAAGGALGVFLFWPPYRLTGLAERVLKPVPNVRSTTKVLGGILFFTAWIVLLGLGVGALAGRNAGIAVAAVLPPIAFATLAFRDRWMRARRKARLFLLARFRPDRLAALRTRQREIAESITALVDTPRGDSSLDRVDPRGGAAPQAETVSPE